MRSWRVSTQCSHYEDTQETKTISKNGRKWHLLLVAPDCHYCVKWPFCPSLKIGPRLRLQSVNRVVFHLGPDPFTRKPPAPLSFQTLQSFTHFSNHTELRFWEEGKLLSLENVFPENARRHWQTPNRHHIFSPRRYIEPPEFNFSFQIFFIFMFFFVFGDW